MTERTESRQISEAVEKAARRIAAQTEQFLASAEDTEDSGCGDTVDLMYNGSRMTLRRSEYERLKAENRREQEEMKTAIKEAVQAIKEKAASRTREPEE